MSRPRLTALPVTDVPLRAFIYDRNSRVINGVVTSTKDTNTENQRLCAHNGWHIAGQFCDPGRSASRYARKAREDYERMLGQIEAGQCDVLVIWEASRGYRNTRTYLDLRDLLEEQGVLLCYNGRTYDMSNRSDRFVTLLDAGRAEDEAEAIRERNLRTTGLNAERGGVHGRLGYGNKRIYDEETGKLREQVPDPERAPIVREATFRVAASQALRKIVKDFTERGVPQPKGGWTESALRYIVLRPSNIGLREHNGVIVGKGVWDPILKTDEEVAAYYAAVGVLTDSARRWSQDTTAKYLMSGVALCGACAKDEPPRRVRISSGAGGRAGFVKTNYACKSCGRVSVGQELFDEIVEATVVAYVERPEFAAALVPRRGAGVADALAQAAALEQQLADARTAAATWDAAAKRMRLPVETLAKLEASLLPQIEAARARAQDATVPAVLRRLAGPGARKRWGALELEERKAAIRAVVEVTLNPAGRGTRTVKPGRISWRWIR